MGTGQLLVIVGLIFSAFASLILALAELKIKREAKALVAEKWRPHPEVVKLLYERRKYALISVILLFIGFTLQLVGTIML